MLKFKRGLASEFKMKDLGMVHYFLRLEVWQRLGEIFLSQGNYVMNLLEILRMIEYKSLATPMQMNFKKLCGDAAGPDLENSSKY